MIKFTKYPSAKLIKSLNDVTNIDPLSKYIATEKINGSQTTIYVSNDEIEVGTKKAIVDIDNEDYQFCVQKDLLNNKELLTYFEKVGKNILTKYSNSDFVMFVGEYFGKDIFNMDYIQNKSDLRDFKLFDIILHLSENDGDNDRIRLSDDKSSSFVNKNYFVPEVKRGTFNELVKFALDNCEKESVYGGLMEGFVLKPEGEIRYSSETPSALNAFKVKGKEFQEVIKKNKKPKLSNEERMKNKLSQSEINAVYSIYKYINQVRLKSVLSHNGFVSVDKHNKNIIVNDLIGDAIKDFSIDSNIDSESIEHLKNYLIPQTLTTIFNSK